MKTFNSLASFTKHLEKVVADFPKYEKLAGTLLAKELKKEARDKIGHLQHAAGPFEAWAPLAESTKTDKERQGYVFNHEYNPLYRTGELKESIDASYIPAMHKIFLGSTSDIMIYQEMGTMHIPPRSVIGATMFQAKHPINVTFGMMLKNWVSSEPLSFRVRWHGSV